MAEATINNTTVEDTDEAKKNNIARPAKQVGMFSEMVTSTEDPRDVKLYKAGPMPLYYPTL